MRPALRLGGLAVGGLLLACALASDTLALEDVWGKPITLTFEIAPDHLILGDRRQALVVIKISGAAPAGAAQAPLKLWTSTGTLSEAQRKPDHWVSTYTAPKTRFPQVAVITASLILEEDRLNGWTVLPLYGKGRARVRARPRSKVWVEIDDRRFGPVRADKRGRAVIPIIVPPGVDHATSSGKRIPLALPKFNRLAGVLDSPSLACGQEGRTAVWLYAVEPDGRPAGMAELWVEAERGQVSEVESLEPGAFRVWYQAPASLGDGQDCIRAALKGAAGSKLSLPVELRAGPPYRVGLSLSRPAWTAGDKEPITIEARLLDAGDNKARGNIEVGADFGALGKPQRTGPGSLRATLALPDQLLGRNAVTVRAWLPEGPKAEVQLGLEPAEPHWLKIEPPDGPVKADGKSEIRLKVIARDRFNNASPTGKLAVKARLGKAWLRYEGPAAVLHYRPPLLIDDKTDTLSVSTQAGPKAELRIELEP